MILLELAGGGVDITARKSVSLFLTETVGVASLGLLIGNQGRVFAMSDVTR